MTKVFFELLVEKRGLARLVGARLELTEEGLWILDAVMGGFLEELPLN